MSKRIVERTEKCNCTCEHCPETHKVQVEIEVQDPIILELRMGDDAIVIGGSHKGQKCSLRHATMDARNQRAFAVVYSDGSTGIEAVRFLSPITDGNSVNQLRKVK